MTTPRLTDQSISDRSALYVRSSTMTPEAEHDQLRDLHAFLEQHGAKTSTAIFIDRGINGMSRETGFAQILEHLRRGEIHFNTLLIQSKCRLTHDRKQFDHRRAQLNALNVRVVIVDEFG